MDADQPVRARLKAYGQLCGGRRSLRNGGLVLRVPALLQRLPADCPVQSTAVEHLPVQLPRQRAGQRALARAAGTVQRDNRRQVTHAAASRTPMSRPAWRARATKSGKDVATLSQSSIVIGPLARRAAMLNAMAMR